MELNFTQITYIILIINLNYNYLTVFQEVFFKKMNIQIFIFSSVICLQTKKLHKYIKSRFIII